MVGSWIVRSDIGDACLGGSSANLTPPIHAAQRAPNADGDAGDHEFVADSPLEEDGFEPSVPRVRETESVQLIRALAMKDPTRARALSLMALGGACA